VLGFEADEIDAIRLLTRDGRPAIHDWHPPYAAGVAVLKRDE
jgi:hypothetical protein